MLKIEGITSDAKQRHAITLPDNSGLSLLILYCHLQVGWFIDELVYGDFVLRGVRISNFPNILRQWKNVIPFGLACFTAGNREPTQQEDFLSGASTLYILDEDEVAELEEIFTEG